LFYSKNNQKYWWKTGSIQQFATNTDIIGDVSTSLFLPKQIQKIAVLDIRLLNCDRNDENLLV